MFLKDRITLLGAACIGLLLGCLLAEVLPWLPMLPTLMFGFSACLLLVWPKSLLRFSVILIICFCIGWMRWHEALRVWNVSPPTGQDLAIDGWLTTPLQEQNGSNRGIVVVEKMEQGRSLIRFTGQLRVATNFKPDLTLHYGDQVHFTAKLQRLPRFGTFDGVRYWRAKHVQAIASARDVSITSTNKGNALVKAVYNLKAYSAMRVKSILPSVEGTLLLGLLFGDQGQLPKDVQQQFRSLGISHLTAVSGYNLTIISLWPVALAGLLPKRKAILAAGILVALFVLFTGAPSSIVRAGIMAWVVLAGKLIGRAPHTMLLILLTASVMALVNPFVVKDDAGFALSFLAFFGLVELGPLIARRLNWIKKDWARLLLAETLGAQIATLPYLLGIFGQFAIVAPLANLIILPLVPPLMIIGLGLTILALAPIVLFLKLVGLLYYPMHGLLFMIAGGASIPYVSVAWPRGGYFPWFLGLVILLWWFWQRWNTGLVARKAMTIDTKHVQEDNRIDKE